MTISLTSALQAPRRRRWVDRGLVAVIGFIGLATALGIEGSAGAHVARLLAAVLAAAPLLFRHRHPIPVLAVVLVVTVASGFGPVFTLPLLLAMLTVTTDCARLEIVGSAVVCGLALILTPVIHHSSGESLPAVASRVFVLGMVIAFGLYLRARAAYVGGLRERAERLEREHELLATQAVADERVRIARELHDVVAHHVSLMVVQAQAAATSPAADEATRAALGRVGNLGREALSEMHRMLGVLRIGDGNAVERAPQPGVAELDALVQSTRATGIEVALQTSGTPYPLPAGVELTVYRIAQEALTNVVRHAHACEARVGLAYGPAELTLTVSDDGRGRLEGGAPAVGHGLVGMRERVALFGGSLEASDREDRPGFRVRAVIPVPDAPVQRTAELVSAVSRKVG